MRVVLAGLLLLLGAQSALAGAGGPDGTGVAHVLPEPASIALLAAGVAGVFAIRRRTGRK